jgi:hypothetical protein
MRQLAIALAAGCTVCALGAACGRLGFEARGSDAADDGATADDALAVFMDASADAPPPTGPFGTPTAVTGLNSGDDDDPTLSADQLEIFFDSRRAGGVGGGDLWTSVRGILGAPWGPPTNVSVLNTTGDDVTPELVRDGLTLYFSGPGPAGQKDIYYATRPARDAAWSTRVHVPQLSSAADEAGPTLTADQLTLYFARDPAGNDDIYRSTRASVGAAWSTPVAVSFNSPTANDAEPFVNGNDTLLLFASNRGGNMDLYMVRRATPADPWGVPQPISELNTNAAENDPWLSPDEHVLYFSRNSAIFMATR